MARLRLCALAIVVLAWTGGASGASAAGTATLVSDPSTEPWLEAVTPGFVYFTASRDGSSSLYRRSLGGPLETVASGGHFAAEAAGGVVVHTRHSLVAHDEGPGDDVYLIRPGGPILLTAGVPAGTPCGKTADGGTSECLNGFSSVTPDGRGIVFFSDRHLTPDYTCTDWEVDSCNVYVWRDGQVRQLNPDMPETYNKFRPWGGFTTDDHSTRILTGENLANRFVQDPVVMFFRAGHGRTSLRRQLLAVSADRLSVLVGGFEDDPAIARWNGDTPVPIGPTEPRRGVTFLGASSDLQTVYYAAETETGDGRYDLWVNDRGVDRRLSPAPVAGPASDTPAPDSSGGLDMHAETTALSPDGRQIAFITGERLLAEDQNALHDVYLASATGELRLVSSGRAGGIRGLAGLTDDAVAFTTSEATACDDRDLADDLYVRQGGALILATPGTETHADAKGQLLPDGDVVFHTYEGLGPAKTDDTRGALWRTTPVSGECALPLGLTAQVRRAARRECRTTPCGKRGVVAVTVSRPAHVTVAIRRRTRFARVLGQEVGAGTTRLKLPYLSRRFQPQRRYRMKIIARTDGGARAVVTRRIRVVGR